MRQSPLDPWLAAGMGLAEPSSEAVAAWQLRELRRTLAWTREASPFHAGRLEGIDLNTLRQPADLTLLPRMTPVDLAAPGLLTVSQDEVARVVTLATSGSSGPPKRLLFSEADLARTLDFFRVGMGTLAGPGDAVLVLLPGRRDQGVADLLSRALPGIGARAVLPAEGWTPADLPGLLEAEAVTCLIAAPAQLLALLANAGASAACRRLLRALLASGEPLPPDLRAEVELAWSCEVFDHWGMTETGYGGG
ncbi:MAG: AMP-binding protein, partial [Humidesulfovibrio sp.]|nr:AMP-binding protein [Humidesulfovibrio sp.]